MGNFSYDPGIAYHGDAYTQQAGQALAQHVTDAFQQAHADRLANEVEQANLAKAKVTANYLMNVTDPLTGRPALSPDDMAEFTQTSLKNPKKAMEIIAGASNNLATGVAMQHQRTQAYGQNAEAALRFAQTNRILNPPPVPPLGVVQVPNPAGGNVNVIQGGGMKPQIIKDENGKDKLQLTPEELATGHSLGFKPLRQSNGSFVWEKDPTAQLASNTDAVKNFDAHIGKTYGVKSADIFGMNLLTPNAIKYQDSSGKDLTTEEATKLGYGADAVVPLNGEIGTKTKRIPLPEWNAIVNEWKALPRAGAAAAPETAAPVAGDIKRGYKFNGGDPSDPNSWTKVP